MKSKTTLLTLLVCLVAATCFVTSALAKESPHMGTWKLNESKSKIAKGAARNHTVVYEAAGDQVKAIVDGVDGDGTATHNEWTGKWDGKFYAVTGDATSDERSYRKVNVNTLAMTGRKGGKVTITGTIVVSRNGKTRTVTTSGTDAKGKKFRTVAVYDKA
jgi:hypothetical protein